MNRGSQRMESSSISTVTLHRYIHFAFIEDAALRTITEEQHAVGGNSNAYHRINVGILIVDSFHSQTFSDYITTGIDDGDIFRMRHYMIKVTDTYLIEQDAENKYSRRQYVIKYKYGSPGEGMCYQNRQADDSKMENT